MADIDTATWSETAASNNAATPAGWPEGQAYSTVNDCAREMMGALKRDWNRSHPTLATAGTASALTLTYTTAPSAYIQGLEFAFRANQDVGAAATLNVNGLGAVAIKRASPSGLVSLLQNDIRSGQLVVVCYDANAAAFIVVSGDAKTGMRHLTTFSVSATTNLIFNLPSGIRNFRIIGSGLSVTGASTSGVTMIMQISANGTTFSGTSTGGLYLIGGFEQTTVSPNVVGFSTTYPGFVLADNLDPTADDYFFEGVFSVGATGITVSKWTGTCNCSTASPAVYGAQLQAGKTLHSVVPIAIKFSYNTTGASFFAARGFISIYAMMEGA